MGFDIIKKGLIKDKWLGRCNRCGAVVGCRTKDLKKSEFEIKNGDHTNSYEKYCWIKCPYCGIERGVCMHDEGSSMYYALDKELV